MARVRQMLAFGIVVVVAVAFLLYTCMRVCVHTSGLFAIILHTERIKKIRFGRHCLKENSEAERGNVCLCIRVCFPTFK